MGAKEKKYRESHREEIAAKQKAKYWGDIEETRRIKREQARRLRLANPEKYREIRRRWDRAHPEKIAEYREKHKHRYKVQRAVSDRRKRLRQLCGVTLEWYDMMWEKQGGVCAICGNGETAKQKERFLPLSVDHDHETKEPRGLLCSNCNRGIGSLGDSTDRLMATYEYLVQYGKPRVG